MGRTVLSDEVLQQRLSFIANAGFQIGVLIGQFNKDKDYLIHLAPTPAPEDEPESCSEGEDEANRRPPPQVPDSIATVDELLVTQHAKQVIRMLPGGLDIVGIFVATPSPDFAAIVSQAKLRTILNNIHKAISKGYLGMSEPSSEKLLLHLCTQTHKYSLRTVPLSQLGVPPIPTDLKFQRGGIRWQQLNYSYKIALTLWLPKDRSSQALYKLFVGLIKPWAENIKKCVILINGKLLDKDDYVDPCTEEKPIKKKGSSRSLMDLHPPKVFQIEILDSCQHQQIFPSGKEESSGCVRFNGTIAGRAFIKPKALAEEAFEAVQCDLIRSVVSRWEMHCDSLVDDPSMTSSGPIVHEPPRRVFLEGGGLPVSLCDYLFPGDTNADACQSALELLDVTVSEDNVDSSLECLANVEEVLSCSHDNHSNNLGAVSNSDATNWVCPPMNFVYFIVAVAVVFLSIGFSYFSMSGSKKLSDFT